MGLPGVGPTGATHCPGGQVYRFMVREGPPSHGGVNARVAVGTYYRKCMGCGATLPDEEGPDG